MRGCWFAKFMKGNQNQTKGQVRANNDATRTKVAVASEQSKAVAEAGGKADGPVESNSVKIWKSAAKAVIEYENEEEVRGASDAENEDDYEYTPDE